jgi:microcystin-dependent protein
MNRQIFNSLGGFPLETNNLEWMQQAYDIFNTLGYVAGDKTIIYGCATSGANTTDGYVFVNGELFKFKGGPTQSKVRILETEDSKIFENGETKVVHKERYVTFASGTGEMNWSDFKSVESLKNIQSRILPPGTNPQLYTGSVASIPTGWQLCDGSNGTPDLRGRFIVGLHPSDTDYNAIGKKGGAKEVTLNINQIPSHNHSGTVTIPAHSHTYQKSVPGRGYRTQSDDTPHSAYQNAETSTSPAQSASISTSNNGGDQAHENRPPYYTLAYIIYKG